MPNRGGAPASLRILSTCPAAALPVDLSRPDGNRRPRFACSFRVDDARQNQQSRIRPERMSFEIPGVLWRRDPEAAELPLVFDSPHSGSRSIPRISRFSCALENLRRAEDAYVDELYAAAPASWATLIGALFPRSYLDANRAVDDIDDALIDGVWPSPLRPSHNDPGRARSSAGSPGRACRSTKASSPPPRSWPGSSAAIRPITGCSTTPAPGCTANSARCGISTAIRCRPSAARGIVGRPADFVLGDRDGTTCASGIHRFCRRLAARPRL